MQVEEFFYCIETLPHSWRMPLMCLFPFQYLATSPLAQTGYSQIPYQGGAMIQGLQIDVNSIKF